MVWLQAAVVGAALVLAGCSDDEPDQAATSTTSAPAGTAAAPDADVPEDPFCAPSQALGEGFDEISPGSANPDELRAQFTRAREAIAQTQAEAPEEIQDDIAVLAEGYEEFLAALDAVDYDLSQLELSDLTALDTPEMQAASQRLDAYRNAVCGTGA